MTGRANAAYGIEVGPATDWSAARTQVTPPLGFELVAGGRSNLTYRVTDVDGRRWVLRRRLLHSVLASAHDAGRQHRIMVALQDTAVPVPPLVGNELSDEVIGAPFAVMEFVDGLVPRDAEAVTSTLDEPARTATVFNLANTLADLHVVDVEEVGLGDLAKRTDYIARQLHRWSGQYAKGSERDVPLVMAVHDRLATDIPALVTSTLAEVRAITDRLGVVTIVMEQNVRAALAVADRAVVLEAGDFDLSVDASKLQGTEGIWRLF